MEKAVAVKYHQDLPAPFVVAKGKRALAKKLVQMAKEHGIEIIEEETLADRLVTLDIGSWIPEDLYAVMAEILAFVYTSERDHMRKRGM
jgi:flagellar biosynthesis protein